MSWSDPEPTPAPRPAFRAGLSLVGSGGSNGSNGSGGLRNRTAHEARQSGQDIEPSRPFGQSEDQLGNFGQGTRRSSGLSGLPGLSALGQNLGVLLEQHFEQLGECPATPSTPDVPTGKVRPAVFSIFGAEAAAQAAAEARAKAEADAAQQEQELEVVEPAEPAPDVEAIKAQAWNEGFQEGYAEGIRLAGEEQKDTTIRLGALLHDIVADTEGFVRGMETDVVELVLAIAEKVVGRETRTDPQIVVNVVRSALNEIHDATEVRIRAHPDDVTILEPRWQEMLPRRVAERSELLADELVERGGVVVETQIGYVDSQIKTRLQQVINTFQAVLDGEPV